MNVYNEEGCLHVEHGDILIVGEGNFSFAKEFSNQTTTKVFATSYDSRETVHKNDFAKSNVEFLNSLQHVEIVHSIDATNLKEVFQNKMFSKIIFNFPHVGGKSNIRKCRLLLKNFFASACQHICDEGSIVVALCKGQGGTPVDEGRGAYGNTWQVVSQAAYSDLYLARLETFHFEQLEHYKQAGYRGEIGSGFLTRGGYLHVFKTGRTFRLVSHLDSANRTSTQDLSLPYQVKEIIARLNLSSTAFSYLESLLKQLMNTNQEVIEAINTEQLAQYFPVNVLENGRLFLENLSVPVSRILSENGVCCFKVNTVDPCLSITPRSSSLSQHMVFLMTLHKMDLDTRIKQIARSIFGQFDYRIQDCFCPVGMNQCSCIYGDNQLCPLMNESCGDNGIGYDVDKIPYFLEDVPESFWSCSEPECTISSKHVVEDGEQEDKVVYEKVNYNHYILDESEKKYFGTHSPRDDNELCSQKKIMVNGLCVATIQTVDDGCVAGDVDVGVYLHLDHILLSCYNVQDVRLLYTEDNVFENQLADEIVTDIKAQHISVKTRTRYDTTIKYPLCHRHDLCFWLDDSFTERQLYSMIRLITGDYLHSVRLLKVLKYTESNLYSYCYRLMYSRYDGPLHHEQCVAVQNELRKCFLAIGVSLR